MICRTMTLYALLMGILLSGCLPRPFADFPGVWVSDGYNTVLEIKDDSFSVYDRTAISLLETDKGSLSDLAKSMAIVGASEDKQSITVTFAGTVTRFKFRRADSLASVRPEHAIIAATNDPEINFEVFWQTFAENYAFFGLRGVDWNAVYAAYRPQVTPSTSAGELFALFKAMLLPFNDGHVTLFNGSEGFSAEAPWGVWADLQAEFAAQRVYTELEAFLADMLQTFLTNIQGHYLSEYYGIMGNDRVMWGRLAEDVGYINVMGMEGLGNEALFGPDGALRAADRIMDRVLRDLRDVDTMVIDLRINGGGYDGVSLVMARHFTGQPVLGFAKKAVFGEGYTMPQEVWISPDESHPFQGRIIVLTSSLTASAAEVFALCLRALPEVTLVGGATSGGFSDIQDRKLPNGWQFSVSNEIYSDANGVCYEGVGLPPDVPAPYPNAADRENGIDPGLDAVLSLLHESR